MTDMQPILLDTCAAIWVAEDERITDSATRLLDEANAIGVSTYVSPITAWEVAQLVSRGRLQMPSTPQRWFERITALPNISLAGMGPNLLIESCFLPGKPPRDPADRIMAATARDLGAILVTRDRALLDYGEQGHISTITC